MGLLEFLRGNWGDLASVLSALLTILFSYNAARLAKSADVAAHETRKKLTSIDLLSEINRIDGRIDDLLVRLENQHWLLVTERATDIRVSIAGIIPEASKILTDDTRDGLSTAVAQFKDIAAAADRMQHRRKISNDATRYRGIVFDQKETLRKALVEAKTSLGDGK